MKCCNYLTTFHFTNFSLCSDLIDIYHNYPCKLYCNNTTGATSGAGTASHSAASEFTPGF